MLDFKDKICFVSGAGSDKGIGFAIATVLGRQGGTLVITDVVEKVFDRAKELRTQGVDCEAYQCDLTDQDAVNEMIASIIVKHGRIDVLMNNAGWHVEGETEEYPEFTDAVDEDWILKFSRNLVTNYNVTKAVLPFMRKNKYGRIVNTASVIGPLLGAEGDTAYAAGKGAVVGLSHSLALEVAKENITINNILPGFISSGAQESDAYRAGLKTPAGRNGSPLEVANVAVFLASEEASYVTGQSIVIDGGSSIEMRFEE